MVAYVPPAPVTVVATFRAVYDGHCRGCDFGIGPGDTIHKLSDDSYVHAGCQP